jgi:hypothetical protein
MRKNGKTDKTKDCGKVENPAVGLDLNLKIVAAGLVPGNQVSDMEDNLQKVSHKAEEKKQMGRQ